ncbi:uncharacterized protein DEA37_0001489, partial [Paragonimus westermani]
YPVENKTQVISLFCLVGSSSTFCSGFSHTTLFTVLSTGTTNNSDYSRIDVSRYIECCAPEAAGMNMFGSILRIVLICTAYRFTSGLASACLLPGKEANGSDI